MQITRSTCNWFLISMKLCHQHSVCMSFHLSEITIIIAKNTENYRRKPRWRLVFQTDISGPLMDRTIMCSNRPSCPLACIQRHCAVFSPSCLTRFFLLWNSTDLEWRGCRIQLCMHMFEVLSLMKLSLIPGNTYHGFPARKTCHTITTTNVPTFLNIVPSLCEYKLVKPVAWSQFMTVWWT
jgi:hypothetical protein